MSNQEGSRWDFIENNLFFNTLHGLFSEWLSWMNFNLTENLAVIHSSEWRPVHMGWFTSSYCSCRSCIG